MKKVIFKHYDIDEFKQFLSCLSYKDRDKLLLTINSIENMGLLIAIKMKWVKKISHNLYEIRSKRASNIQRCLYFHIINNKYLITNSFTKKSQKTPRREIEKAINRRNKYFLRSDYID